MKSIFFCCMTLCFLSCSTREPDRTAMGNRNSLISKNNDRDLPMEILRIDFADLNRFPKDEYHINKIFIGNDVLHIDISYGGGCQTHEFFLLADGENKDSIPDQIDMFLSHNAHDDSCEAFLTKELLFDLAPLKKQIIGADAEGPGTIDLNIRLTDNTSLRIAYAFEMRPEELIDKQLEFYN